MELVPIFVFWSLALWGMFSPKPVLIYLFFATMSFGSFAVIPAEITAGLTFTPTPVVALLLTCRTLFNEVGLIFVFQTAFDIRRLGLLSAFFVVAIITTLFMPRYFAWQVEIVPMRALSGQPDLLQPTTQNVSQLIYLGISVAAVFAFARLLQSSGMREHALKAICLGSAIAVITGSLDLATRWFPIGPVLEPFRTATYALLTDVEVLDTKRVVGLTPEASSYGALCIGFLSSLYFFRRAMPKSKLRDVFVPALMALLALFVWLSTSSSAYLGLAVLAALMGLDWLARAAVSNRNLLWRRDLIIEFWAAFGMVAFALLVVIAEPSLLDPITNMIDEVVFQKAHSQSFEERSMWTAISFQAFIDTYGLGVGMGGTRASNAVVAVLSNVGVLGAILYYGFVVQSMMRRSDPGDSDGSAMMSAARWALIPSFFIALTAETTANFGLFNAFYFSVFSSMGRFGKIDMPVVPVKFRKFSEI